MVHTPRQQRLHKLVVVPPEKQLKYLSDRHKEIMRQLTCGIAPKTVAERLNISVSCVHMARRTELGKEEANRLHQQHDVSVIDFASQMRKGSEASVSYLLDALDPATETGQVFKAMPPLKVKVAMDFLDRDGRAPKVQRSQSEATIVHLTHKDVEAIRARKTAAQSTTRED